MEPETADLGLLKGDCPVFLRQGPHTLAPSTVIPVDKAFFLPIRLILLERIQILHGNSQELIRPTVLLFGLEKRIWDTGAISHSIQTILLEL